jgi:hypothetical protein
MIKKELLGVNKQDYSMSLLKLLEKSTKIKTEEIPKDDLEIMKMLESDELWGIPDASASDDERYMLAYYKKNYLLYFCCAYLELNREIINRNIRVGGFKNFEDMIEKIYYSSLVFGDDDDEQEFYNMSQEMQVMVTCYKIWQSGIMVISNSENCDYTKFVIIEGKIYALSKKWGEEMDKILLKKCIVKKYDRYYYKKLKKFMARKIKEGEVEWIYAYGDKLIKAGKLGVLRKINEIVETKECDNTYISPEDLYKKCLQLKKKYWFLSKLVGRAKLA